jgi:hypothetical protein
MMSDDDRLMSGAQAGMPEENWPFLRTLVRTQSRLRKDLKDRYMAIERFYENPR